MTILERRRYREDLLVKEIALAYRRVNVYRLSVPCSDAMVATGSDPARARALHASCRGEDPGQPGCLCQCHDTVTGGVETGEMTQMT